MRQWQALGYISRDLISWCRRIVLIDVCCRAAVMASIYDERAISSAPSEAFDAGVVSARELCQYYCPIHITPALS